MSSATCPAIAWRNVLLEVVTLEAEGGATGPSWQTPAGTFADEYADSIRTSLVRGLAEGRMLTLRISEEGGASVLITRAAAGKPEAAVELRQLRDDLEAIKGQLSAARHERCRSAAPAELAAVEKSLDRAQRRIAEATTKREGSIQWLLDDTRELAEARAEASRLEQQRAELLTSIGAGA